MKWVLLAVMVAWTIDVLSSPSPSLKDPTPRTLQDLSTRGEVGCLLVLAWVITIVVILWI